jgi:ActR/RegA family two-component response regulator
MNEEHKILFLDDDKRRIFEFLSFMPMAVRTCETAEECIALLKKETWDYIFLDHDLGGEVHVDSGREDCGMEVVRFMVKNNIKPKEKVFVHTMNKPASQLMVGALQDMGINVQWTPFHMLKDSLSFV